MGEISAGNAYTGYTDEELVSMIRGGDMEATDFLMEKYKDLARGKARSMFILGGESEDLIQEGMIGLFKAIRDYEPDRDASFRTFASLCVTRQIYKAVQASGRKKHLPLNTAISLDDAAEDTGAEHAAADPETQLIDRESAEDLMRRIEESLSPFEREVMDLLVTGLNYTEIAAILGRSEKAADNAIQRIRTKIRRVRE